MRWAEYLLQRHPRVTWGLTAPTAVLNTCMDEKEIHSKSTLKRRHLIPETVTDLIVAGGRGETGKFSQRMFMVVHFLLVT